MYILSYSLIIYKIKVVKNTDFPHSEGPALIHLTGCWEYEFFSIFVLLKLFLLINGLVVLFEVE